MTIACMIEEEAIFDPSGNSHFFIVKRNRPDGETGKQTPMTYIVDLGHNVDIINMAMTPNVFITTDDGICSFSSRSAQKYSQLITKFVLQLNDESFHHMVVIVHACRHTTTFRLLCFSIIHIENVVVVAVDASSGFQRCSTGRGGESTDTHVPTFDGCDCQSARSCSMWF